MMNIIMKDQLLSKNYSLALHLFRIRQYLTYLKFRFLYLENG